MRRVLSLILLAALLAGCGGTPTQPATPTALPGAPAPTAAGEEGAVTISFAAWDYERAIYEPLAERFSAENPGIKIAIVPLDDLMAPPMAGGPPQGPESPVAGLRRIVSGADTAPSFGIVPEAIGTPLLLDLAPLMDADATFSRDDFYPGALERWTAKGGTWVLPRYFYLQTLSYNKDLFALANLPEPEAGWTWDELLATAEQLSQGGGVNQTYGLLDTSGGMLPLLAILQGRGIDIFNPPSDLNLTDQIYVDALNEVRDLYARGVLYNPYQMGARGGAGEYVDPAQVVREGRVAIWGDVYFDGPNGQPTEPLPFSVGRVPYPRGPNDIFSGGAEGYIISGGTAYPNESWKWVEFLSRQQIERPGEAMPGMSGPPGRVPARQSLAEAMGFWEQLDEETAAAYRWALENGPPMQERTPDYLALSALSQAMSQASSDTNLDVEQALADAQRWLEETQAQVLLTPTPEPDTSPVLVATPEPQEAPAGATRITFLTYGYSPTEIRRIARAFREQHPDIFVELKTTDTFTGPVELADMARLSDCFSWTQPPRGEADFAALLDIQPLLDADATFSRDDYPAALLAPYQSGTGLYGLPYGFNLRTLNYNRTMFDSVGIETPTADWTPADFLAAAQALTSGEGSQKQYGYVPLGGPQTDMMFFVNRFGGRLTSGSGQDMRPNFTDPKTVEALQWYIDLAKVHQVMPPIKFYYRRDDPGFEDRSYELVQGGRAGMWFDSGYGMFNPEFMEGIDGRPGAPSISFEVGIAPLPTGSGGLSSGDFYVRGFHISASTQSPQACWEWLKFLSGDTSLLYSDIPARTSVAQSEAYTSSASQSTLEVYELYKDVLQRPSQPGEDPNAFYMMDSYWFFKALSAAIDDDADLATELAAAQETTTTYLECVARGGTPPSCALEADPDYKGFNTEENRPMPLGMAP